MAKIVVGVTGSVAIIRTPDLVRELVRKGYDVECVMTKAATKLIRSELLHWASTKKVILKLTGALEHVQLLGIGGTADLLVISPTTANTISKIAQGIDDTPVTTMAQTAIGSKTPVIIVPAMHQSMYENPFVVENIEKLKKAGITFVEPEVKENKAKLADNKKIIQKIDELIE